MKKIAVLLVVLLMCMTAGHAEILEERIAVLRTLGIEVPETAVEDIRESIAEIGAMIAGTESEASLEYFYSDYCYLLSWLGMGDYDVEINDFVPYCDDVFAFDAEMYDVCGDYITLLEAVARISGGAVSVANCEVDAQEMIWGTGLGIQLVRFELNGVPREFTAQVQNDWMDVSIIDYLNQCLEEDGAQLRVWCMFDMGQGFIVFCDTPEWAAQFESATGYALSMSANDNF